MTERGSLDTYLQRRFDEVDPTKLEIPMPPEFHVAWWRSGPAASGSTAQDLVDQIVQFRIDVADGASESEQYQRLVRQADAPTDRDAPSRPVFDAPDDVSIRVFEHAGGALPILSCGRRSDFERCFRTLAGRCEPIDVPVAVHALYLAGLPNPARTRTLHRKWLDDGGPEFGWPEEMRRLRNEDSTAFHDAMILVHDAPYSGLAASDVDANYSDGEWLERSRTLRLEHEFTHHATHRILGSYRLHVLDELFADFMGFTKATGRFDAVVFLAGLGIVDDHVDDDARLWTYVRDLDRADIPALVELTATIASNLEQVAPLFATQDERRFERLMILAQSDMKRLGQRNWPRRFEDSLRS